MVEPGLALHRLDGPVFHFPALLLLLFSFVCHLLHQFYEGLHVCFNLAHVLIEIVDDFKGGLGLWNAQVFIILYNFLYLDDALDLFFDLLYFTLGYFVAGVI